MDTAAMRFHNIAANAQAKTRTARGTVTRAFHPKQAFKQVRQSVIGNAGRGICEQNIHPTCLYPRTDVQLPRLVGVAQAIFQQILEQLLQTLGISLNQHRLLAQAVRVHLQTLFLQRGTVHSEGFLQHHNKVEAFFTVTQRPAVRHGKVV